MHARKRNFVASLNACQILNLIFIWYVCSTFLVVSHGVENDRENEGAKREKREKKKKKRKKVARIALNSRARNGVAHGSIRQPRLKFATDGGATRKYFPISGKERE